MFRTMKERSRSWPLARSVRSRRSAACFALLHEGSEYLIEFVRHDLREMVPRLNDRAPATSCSGNGVGTSLKRRVPTAGNHKQRNGCFLDYLELAAEYGLVRDPDATKRPSQSRQLLLIASAAHFRGDSEQLEQPPGSTRVWEGEDHRPN